MRVLVTIPHFCQSGDRAGGPGFYGSETASRALRRDQVRASLASVAQVFGPRQAMMGHDPALQANAALHHQLDIALVTTGPHHLADELPRDLFTHVATDADPRCLGFVCHGLMRDNAERYDWFAYMEDDLAVHDGLFLAKLAWFNARFGPAALLQPNRFERADDLSILKLYVDGNTTVPEIPARFQDITVRPRLEAEAFGLPLRFSRVENVHSGCFFADRAQLARLLDWPGFGTPTAEFFGPLESAATLPIMRCFDVYKPALDHAAFLELEHLGRRFLVPQPSTPATLAEPEPPPILPEG